MSYVSRQFLPHDSSNLTNFKAWAQAISGAFSSSGWTQTSDTGQVNWSTIASVPTSGTWVYEIWQPGDALQTGSTKFFVKLEYGTNGGNGVRPRLTIGTGTNGSGTLTGYTVGPLDWNGSGGSGGYGSSLTFDCYFSGDVNRIGVMMWRSISNDYATGGAGAGPFMFMIERTKDVNGNDNSDGVHLVSIERSNQARGTATIQFGIGWCAPGHADPDNAGCYPLVGWEWLNASAAFNNKVPVYHVVPSYGIVGNPMTEVAFMHWQDVGEASTFSTTIYGTSHTYITTGVATSLAFPAQNTCQVCMRYD